MSVSEYVIKKLYESDKEIIIGSRIDKILKIDDKNFAFIIYQKNKSYTLLFSLEANLPIYLLGDNLISFVQETNGFFSILKKYLEYGQILQFEKIKNDRIIKLKIKKRLPNYLYKITTLVFEMIPLRANVILLDENDIIIDAFHKSDSLDAKYLLIKGIKYKIEENVSKTINIDETLDSIKFKVSRREYQYLASLNKDEFQNTLKNLLKSDNYYLTENDISCIPLNNNPLKKDELFSSLIKKREYLGRKKHYQQLISFIEKKYISLKKKSQNLKNDLQKCNEHLNYKDIGNLLYYGASCYEKGASEIIIDGIKIKLNQAKNLSENANEYFKKYKKAKSGIQQLTEQIELTNKELSYFEELKLQIIYADDEAYNQIKNQLENDGYLKAKHSNSKKSKNIKIFNPHIINYQNVKIGYGLSSFQNDYLTFTLAHKNDIFLHIKDYHGPHIIIFDENPSEDVLLFAGEVSLYFANQITGDVQYTKRKNIKKIPAKTGMVELIEYKLMHINKIRKETKQILEKLR